eukprot:snap_masked-scaffold_27-processed-gene-4.43-mRNA-1 protein AED:1.00 eAED:1.00 QI:0/0/0/0/1/1/2/0/63
MKPMEYTAIALPVFYILSVVRNLPLLYGKGCTVIYRKKKTIKKNLSSKKLGLFCNLVLMKKKL